MISDPNSYWPSLLPSTRMDWASAITKFGVHGGVPCVTSPSQPTSLQARQKNTQPNPVRGWMLQSNFSRPMLFILPGGLFGDYTLRNFKAPPRIEDTAKEQLPFQLTWHPQHLLIVLLPRRQRLFGASRSEGPAIKICTTNLSHKRCIIRAV